MGAEAGRHWNAWRLNCNQDIFYKKISIFNKRKIKRTEIFLLFYVHVCFIFMPLCEPHMCIVPIKIRRDCHVPKNWKHEWVLGTKPGSFHGKIFLSITETGFIFYYSLWIFLSICVRLYKQECKYRKWIEEGTRVLWR